MVPYNSACCIYPVESVEIAVVTTSVPPRSFKTDGTIGWRHVVVSVVCCKLHSALMFKAITWRCNCYIIIIRMMLVTYTIQIYSIINEKHTDADVKDGRMINYRLNYRKFTFILQQAYIHDKSFHIIKNLYISICNYLK